MPEVETHAAARVQRRYQLMKLPYVDGAEITEVGKLLGISQAGYYREHWVGLDTVVERLVPRNAPEAKGPALATEEPGPLPIWEQAFQALGGLVFESTAVAERGHGPAAPRIPLPEAYLQAGESLRQALKRLRKLR